ncbi:MAG: exodeoxyribonuclease VII small subunit [Saprospirales bacterium]|nr:exodeoxyribonuclease VII small subunit [Saprospirales bacterium]MBK8490259.1 exodeoxyribonuclease VII small subunit [Saprospirales bacterium]
MTYDQALAELRNILQQLQEGQIGMEEMSNKVKRAAELVQLCKEKLRNTEEEVEKLLTKMDE